MAENVEETTEENTEENPVFTETEIRIRNLTSKRDRTNRRLNIYYNELEYLLEVKLRILISVSVKTGVSSVVSSTLSFSAILSHLSFIKTYQK